MFWFVFFFSSRRRHTRWNCDWSSDVCSSDLSKTSSYSTPYRKDGSVRLSVPAAQPAGGLVPGTPACYGNVTRPVGDGSPPLALEPEGPDQVVDVRAREVEAPRRLDHVPALRLKGLPAGSGPGSGAAPPGRQIADLAAFLGRG